MTARIEKVGHAESASIRLIGRIQSRHLDELKAIIAEHATPVTLDLEEVTLVDVEVVRFLISCESRGMEVLNCPRFIRRWMILEQSDLK
jgi:anti-anti-sigma regulatory factor